MFHAYLQSHNFFISQYYLAHIRKITELIIFEGVKIMMFEASNMIGQKINLSE